MLGHEWRDTWQAACHHEALDHTLFAGMQVLIDQAQALDPRLILVLSLLEQCAPLVIMLSLVAVDVQCHLMNQTIRVWGSSLKLNVYLRLILFLAIILLTVLNLLDYDVSALIVGLTGKNSEVRSFEILLSKGAIVQTVGRLWHQLNLSWASRNYGFGLRVALFVLSVLVLGAITSRFNFLLWFRCLFASILALSGVLPLG